MWETFLKEENKSFKNVEKIFPTKQRQISEMINQVKGDNNIKRIIIFGSSVTCLCNPWSDIDVYFDYYDRNLEYFPKFKNKDIQQVWDQWVPCMVDEELLKEIEKTGVVVYERQLRKLTR